MLDQATHASEKDAQEGILGNTCRWRSWNVTTADAEEEGILVRASGWTARNITARDAEEGRKGNARSCEDTESRG